MTKELTKTDTMKDVVGYDEAWGAGTKVDSTDILIPRVWCMQSNSDLVDKKKATKGDFVNSVDETVLGSAEKPLEFIAFDSFKTMRTFIDNKYEKTEMFEPSFAALPWEEEVNGQLIKRQTVINYYILLTEDIKQGIPFPMVLSFKSTSMQAGKKLATIFKKLEMFKKPSAAKVFKLSNHQEENDKGKYLVLDVNEVRNSSIQEVATAKEWFDIVQSSKSNIKVDEEEDLKASTMQSPSVDTEPSSTVKGSAQIPF